MIRKIVDCILYTLHIKKRVEKPPLEALIDLIPLIVLTGIVMQVVIKLLQIPSKLTWRQKLLLWFKNFPRKFRTIVIGY
jgi:hypothetical protein